MASILKFEHYTVVWICAIEIEVHAARLMLNLEHAGSFAATHRDGNNYIGGKINGHNVMIVRPPETGPINTATLASQIKASFPNLLFGMMVGIGGGVPGKNLVPDIRLGDVVIASPNGNSVKL